MCVCALLGGAPGIVVGISGIPENWVTLINWNKIFCHYPFNFFAISDRAIIKYINRIGGNEEKILVQIVFTETRFSGTRSTHHLTMRQELKGRNVFQGRSPRP